MSYRGLSLERAPVILSHSTLTPIQTRLSVPDSIFDIGPIKSHRSSKSITTTLVDDMLSSDFPNYIRPSVEPEITRLPYISPRQIVYPTQNVQISTDIPYLKPLNFTPKKPLIIPSNPFLLPPPQRLPPLSPQQTQPVPPIVLVRPAGRITVEKAIQFENIHLPKHRRVVSNPINTQESRIIYQMNQLQRIPRGNTPLYMSTQTSSRDLETEEDLPRPRRVSFNIPTDEIEVKRPQTREAGKSILKKEDPDQENGDGSFFKWLKNKVSPKRLPSKKQSVIRKLAIKNNHRKSIENLKESLKDLENFES